MPSLSLTDLVDIVSASGTPKATKVRRIKYRLPYNPAADFYKRIRDSIIEAHQQGEDKSALDQTLNGLMDAKKRKAYPAILSGYRKWWGQKELVWFPPPTETYSAHSIDVSVNPELGLEVSGIPHLIKLYFKAEPLSKNRIDIITHLMAVVLGADCPKGTVMSLLDVRRAKLIAPTVPIAGLSGILDAELAYISTLWPTL
jgi:hypothetical protein